MEGVKQERKAYEKILEEVRTDEKARVRAGKGDEQQD